jgi:hypothetical protein
MLLRRRGTSPPVGKAIRRAAQHLDAALAGTGHERNLSIDRSVAELQECLGLIQASAVPADHRQLEGVAAALSSLLSGSEGLRERDAGSTASVAPREAAPAMVLPVSAPPILAVDQAPRSLADTARVRPKKSPRPKGASGALEAALRGCVRLAALHRRRVTVLSDPLLSWRELAALDATLAETGQTLGWLVGRLPTVAMFEDASDDALVRAAFAIHSLGGNWHSVMSPMRELLDTDAPPLADMIRVVAEGTPRLAREAWTLIRPRSAPLGAALVPVLVLTGQISSEELTALATDDDEETVAMAAAAMLACLGAPNVRDRVLERAGAASSTGASATFLFCAVALGSKEALDQLRRMLARPEDVVLHVLEGLAVAGDASDAERLIDFAATDRPLAQEATLASAHLGSAAVSRAIGALGEHVSAATKAAALDALAGGAGSIGRDRAPAELRLLRGTPWSVGASLERILDQDEPVRSRARRALDVASRTGIRPPAAYVSSASASLQGRIAEEWRQHYLKTADRMPQGRWLVGGR